LFHHCPRSGFWPAPWVWTLTPRGEVSQ
jgi:hypothetical protein